MYVDNGILEDPIIHIKLINKKSFFFFLNIVHTQYNSLKIHKRSLTLFAELMPYGLNFLNKIRERKAKKEYIKVSLSYPFDFYINSNVFKLNKPFLILIFLWLLTDLSVAIKIERKKKIIITNLINHWCNAYLFGASHRNYNRYLQNVRICNHWLLGHADLRGSFKQKLGC